MMSVRGIYALALLALVASCVAEEGPIAVNDKLAKPVVQAPAPTKATATPVPIGGKATVSGTQPVAPVAAPKPVITAPKAAPVAAPTVAAPTTAVSAPKTTVAAPKTTVAAPKTTVAAPKTTVAAPKTTVAAPKTTVAAPKTSTTEAAPSTAPKTTVAAPKTTVAAPKTTVAAPKTGTTAPAPSTAPKTTVAAPKTPTAAPASTATSSSSGSGSAPAAEESSSSSGVSSAASNDLTAGYQPVAIKHPRPAGTVDLFRYWSPTRQDHLYLTDFKLLGMGAHGYLFQGSEGYVWPTQKEGTVPFYRYFFRDQNNHYYSTEKKETHGTRHFEGVQAYIYSYESNEEGTVPLYLYHNERLHDHYLTTNFHEFVTEPEWTYEGVVGRIFPLPNFVESEAPGDGTTVGIRRYFNPQSGDHLLTASADGSDMHTWFQWMFQGVTFYCFKDKKQGTTPLRTYYNHFTSDHLATASSTLLGQGSDAWIPEGTLCHVYLTQQPGTVALYRYYNKYIHDHFYTTKKDELGDQGWEYQGIEAYVFAQPMENAHPPMPKTYGDDHSPVYQWWSKLYRDHVFSTDETAYNDYSSFGWVSEGKKFDIFTKPVRGSHPLYQVWNVHMNDMIYTTSSREMTNFTSDAWATYKGVLGHVSIRQAPGTQAIYRYWNSTFGDHLITNHILDSENPYAYDGILGFVPSDELYREFAAGESIKGDKIDSQLVPLYQFFSPGDGDHWYSTSAQYDGHDIRHDGNATHAPKHAGEVLKNANPAIAAQSSHWYYQGIAGFCQAVQTKGTVPMYWAYNPTARDSTLTTEAGEAYRWTKGQEPIPCYVYPKQVPGTVALHRYFSVEDHDHFYTTRTRYMKDLPQYVYQGVSAYVFPAAVAVDPPETTVQPVATAQPWANPKTEDPRHTHH